MGYGKTRGEVIEEGVEVEGGISDGWWCYFRERWPQLSLYEDDPFPQLCSEITTHEVFNSYFDLLRQTLKKS